MKIKKRCLWVSPTLLLLFSCAGPTNPWGHYGAKLPPVNSEVPITVKTIENSYERDFDIGSMRSLASMDSEAKIKFYPPRQNFHETTEFSVYLDDPQSIPENFKLNLYYNGTNVTDQWLSKADITFNENRTRVTLAFHGVKLLAQKRHDVLVRYQRDPITEPLFKTYKGPSCSLSHLEPLGGLGPYEEEIEKSLKNAIEGISTQEGVNPSLVAGLIAQESAFNPMAVSYAKAIGLTQVTGGAETHILEYYKNFPTYPNLNDYPVPMIKTLIVTGKVNEENEWRLAPKHSIRGGIHYLKFVEDYWLKQENHQILLKHYPSEEEILDNLILASYNSGPYRVKKALIKMGPRWLESDTLNEARKYVRKVKSYCYHFAANNKKRPLL